MASVSSVWPSPMVVISNSPNNERKHRSIPFAPNSLTLRNTLYAEGSWLNAATPWWAMSANQYGASPGAATSGGVVGLFVKGFEVKLGVWLPAGSCNTCALVPVNSSQRAASKKQYILVTIPTAGTIHCSFFDSPRIQSCSFICSPRQIVTSHILPVSCNIHVISSCCDFWQEGRSAKTNGNEWPGDTNIHNLFQNTPLSCILDCIKRNIVAHDVKSLGTRPVLDKIRGIVAVNWNTPSSCILDCIKRNIVAHDVKSLGPRPVLDKIRGIVAVNWGPVNSPFRLAFPLQVWCPDTPIPENIKTDFSLFYRSIPLMSSIFLLPPSLFYTHSIACERVADPVFTPFPSFSFLFFVANYSWAPTVSTFITIPLSITEVMASWPWLTYTKLQSFETWHLSMYALVPSFLRPENLQRCDLPTIDIYQLSCLGSREAVPGWMMLASVCKKSSANNNCLSVILRKGRFVADFLVSSMSFTF